MADEISENTVLRDPIIANSTFKTMTQFGFVESDQ